MQKDPLFEQAARLIVNNQKASTSLLQRKLKLGYPRASLLMNQLEVAGVIESEYPNEYDILVKNESDLDHLLIALVKS